LKQVNDPFVEIFSFKNPKTFAGEPFRIRFAYTHGYYLIKGIATGDYLVLSEYYCGINPRS